MTIEQLQKEIKTLCDKYKEEFGICVVIDAEKEYFISGNLCTVCAKEALERLIENEDIRHNPRNVH